MIYAVRPDGVKPGVAENDFQRAPGGRVFSEDGLYVFFQRSEQLNSLLLPFNAGIAGVFIYIILYLYSGFMLIFVIC